MKRIISFSTFRTFSFLVLICTAMISCKTTQKSTVDMKDLSYLYNPTKASIKPRFAVLNESDENSTLSVKFFATDLFFSEANAQSVPMAQVLVTVKLYNLTGGMTLADTSYNDLKIIKETSRSEYVFKIPLKVQPGIEYVAEIKMLDRLRLDVSQAFVPFNTLSENNRYNFYARGHFQKNELFNPVIRVNEYVNLIYPRKHVDSLFISFYKPMKEVPYPPSMMLPEKIIDYDPDTMIALPYNDTLPIMFPKEGLYFCSTARKIDEGFTFYNFGQSFPSMNKPEVMIEPLAYLATEDEMNAMRTAERPKVALDEFWIGCSGNIEKSRELIRIYYTRILYSNYYFTSFKEGWRTERGMIYTIYGPPDKVYKAPGGESWGYLKPVIKSTWGGRVHLKEDYLFFNFKYRQNKFTDNDFFLSRNETLVTLWDKAVASWRKGIVYRLDNPEDL
jgi:GWxTD domain-containing protein